jgi:hypothetical protein
MLHRKFLKDRFREMRKQAASLSPEFMSTVEQSQAGQQDQQDEQNAIETAKVAAEHEALAKIKKERAKGAVDKVTAKIKKANKDDMEAQKAEEAAIAAQNAPQQAPPTSMPGAPPVG